MRCNISISESDAATAVAWMEGAVNAHLIRVRKALENPPKLTSRQVLIALADESPSAATSLWSFLGDGGDIHDLATAAEGPAIFGFIKREQVSCVTALVRHLGLPAVLAFRNPAGESTLEALEVAMAKAEDEDVIALEAIGRCLNGGDCR